MPFSTTGSLEGVWVHRHRHFVAFERASRRLQHGRFGLPRWLMDNGFACREERHAHGVQLQKRGAGKGSARRDQHQRGCTARGLHTDRHTLLGLYPVHRDTKLTGWQVDKPTQIRSKFWTEGSLRSSSSKPKRLHCTMTSCRSTHIVGLMFSVPGQARQYLNLLQCVRQRTVFAPPSLSGHETTRQVARVHHMRTKRGGFRWAS